MSTEMFPVRCDLEPVNTRLDQPEAGLPFAYSMIAKVYGVRPMNKFIFICTSVKSKKKKNRKRKKRNSIFLALLSSILLSSFVLLLLLAIHHSFPSYPLLPSKLDGQLLTCHPCECLRASICER